ncbi:hypothetical protein DIPPA_59569 [Diplonema papillatum]|nr:hypothetical protein DIPPA_59569 [Diplonema papillatum]
MLVSAVAAHHCHSHALTRTQIRDVAEFFSNASENQSSANIVQKFAAANKLGYLDFAQLLHLLFTGPPSDTATFAARNIVRISAEAGHVACDQYMYVCLPSELQLPLTVVAMEEDIIASPEDSLHPFPEAKSNTSEEKVFGCLECNGHFRLRGFSAKRKCPDDSLWICNVCGKNCRDGWRCSECTCCACPDCFGVIRARLGVKAEDGPTVLCPGDRPPYPDTSPPRKSRKTALKSDPTRSNDQREFGPSLKGWEFHVYDSRPGALQKAVADGLRERGAVAGNNGFSAVDPRLHASTYVC